MWRSKFENYVRQAGVDADFSGDVGSVSEGELAVVDYVGNGDAADELIRSLKARGSRVVAHISHSNREAIKSAMSAGVDKVVANGRILVWLDEALNARAKSRTES